MAKTKSPISRLIDAFANLVCVPFLLGPPVAPCAVRVIGIH